VLKQSDAKTLLLGQPLIWVWDPSHEIYSFNPHAFEKAKEPAAWGLSPLPNGDYHIFMNQTWDQGIFGHPWEQTICIFGKTLLSAFASRPPKLFRKIVRRDFRVVSPLDPLVRAG